MADLVTAAKDGDGRAFDELVRATYADAYTLAYRLTGNEEDARDVVQEAYLRAYRGLKRFRGDAQFSTWMYRIMANCASTLLAKRTRHRHDELTDDVADRRRAGPRSTPSRWPTPSCSASGSPTPSESCRPGCGPWSCCATSTTCPTRRSPRSSGSPRRRPRCGCTGPARKLRERLFPLRGEENAHAV